MREKREEKREKKGKKREGRKKNVLGQGGARVRCDFFLLLQAFQVIYKWNQEREAKENQETSKFLFVGKLDFDVFHA